MGQRSRASSQNPFPDSRVVNKVRLLHFLSAWSASVSQTSFASADLFAPALISPEEGDSWPARLPL